MKIHLFAAILFGIIFPISDALCSANIEPDAESIEKVYKNGDSAKLECKNQYRNCDLTIGVHGKKKTVAIDFKAFGFRPEMSQIMLFPGGADPISVVQIEVGCRDIDVDSIGVDTAFVMCLLEINTDGEKLDGSPSIHVFPMMNESTYETIDAKR